MVTQFTTTRLRESKPAGRLAASRRVARSSRAIPLTIGLAITGLTAAQAFAQPEQQARRLVERTLDGLSAGRDIRSVSTIDITGKEISRDLVENDHPLTPPFLISSISTIHQAVDLRKEVRRTDIVVGDLTTNALLTRRYSTTVRTHGSITSRSVTGPVPGWELQDPVGALELAERAPDLCIEPDAVWHGSTQHVLSFHQGQDRLRIYIGVASKLPTATEATVTYDDKSLPLSVSWGALGDVVERTEYLNWSVVNGLRYPLQRDILRDGQVLQTLVVSDVKLDAPVETATLDLRAGEQPPNGSVQDWRPNQEVPGPYPHKPVEELAPGVIQIPNSWYSTIVRQPDGLVVIDAPISTGYANGILAEAAKRFPGVPVKALVTSTGFFWHVAGVRAFAARGIPIYAEARNVAVIERILHAPHQLAPDDLSRQPHPRLRVIAVPNHTTIGSGQNKLDLYSITGSTQPMLMTFFPNLRLLHTAEMVQPLGPNGKILFPESLIELSQTVRAKGLWVDQMIGMHMNPTPWSAIFDTLRGAHATAG